MTESAYTVRGKALRCSVCGAETFEQTHVLAKVNVYFADKPSWARTPQTPVALVCNECGFVHLFRPGSAGPVITD